MSPTEPGSGLRARLVLQNGRHYLVLPGLGKFAMVTGPDIVVHLEKEEVETLGVPDLNTALPDQRVGGACVVSVSGRVRFGPEDDHHVSGSLG